jgi:hypothetical protein
MKYKSSVRKVKKKTIVKKEDSIQGESGGTAETP